MNSTVVEVAVGLILIYLVFGLFCTSINEYLAQMLSLRSETLSDAIHGLFPGPDQHVIAEDILNHPLVESLKRRQFGMNLANGAPLVGEVKKLPPAIPNDLFSDVIVDLLKENSAMPVEEQYDQETLSVLRPLADLQQPSSADKPQIEKWFQAAMDRATDWYKRKLQVVSFLVAVGIVTVVNADTLVIAKRLADSPVERAKLTAYATSVYKTDSDTHLPEGLAGATFDLMGWADPSSNDPRRLPSTAGDWWAKAFGLGLTAMAACLGAPFWFDVLSKVMMVRSGGTGTGLAAKKGGEA